MGAEGKDFIQRDDVRQALEELFDQTSAARVAGEIPSPDVAAFLRERGIEPPAGSPLSLHHGTEPPGCGEAGEDEEAIAPTVNRCDDGTWCVWRCKRDKHGGRSCEWVCA
jgi:hypothetical protein